MKNHREYIPLIINFLERLKDFYNDSIYHRKLFVNNIKSDIDILIDEVQNINSVKIKTLIDFGLEYEQLNFKHRIFENGPTWYFDIFSEIVYVQEKEAEKLKTKIRDEPYDSTSDTLLHIKRVNELLGNFAIEMIRRGQVHDNSKLASPEKELFDTYTPKLKDTTYGSEEYKEYLDELKPALDNHYAKNTHHPEHYTNGIDDMDLYDIVEMFFDWKAAGERHEDGDIYKSIDHNKTRFNMTEQLASIFKNTADRLKIGI